MFVASTANKAKCVFNFKINHHDFNLYKLQILMKLYRNVT